MISDSEETPAPGCQTLTQEQVDFFMDKGYLILHNCFTKEQAAYWLKDVWVRMGLNPNDKSTWYNENDPNSPFGAKIHLPGQRSVHVSEFAPKAWAAICDLVGGEDKISENTKRWRDNFIVNLGEQNPDMDRVDTENPHALENWHTDGGFFLHFLDSPEQGLLVTPVWSDEIKHRGGATFIAPDSIPVVAKELYDHPEGLMPGGPVNAYTRLSNQCKEFVELTGKVSDVIICHPFMLHSASHNALRVPRFITNPAISLKEPFKYDKPQDQLSIVEKTTLKALGLETLSYQITGKRKIFPSMRDDMWARVQKEELERLRAYGTAEEFDNSVPIGHR
jgi:hypothetical protein